MKQYKCIIKSGMLCNEELSADLLKAEGVGVCITVERMGKSARSNPQNRYLRGVVCKEATEYYKENVADFIRDLMLASKADLTPEFVHEMFKMMFNNGKSTTGLCTERMSKYTESIREHMLHAHNLLIEEPRE